MSWTATLWGQPISVNHMYKVAWRTDKRQRPYKGKAKTEQALKYQSDAVQVLRSAKPSRWQPAGQVVITYDIYLQRDIDSDNLMKVIHDAFQIATGVNDARVLPCVRSKLSGVTAREARVELLVEAL